MTPNEYAAIGQLTAQTDAAGVTHTMSYDENGNPTGTSFIWVNPYNPNDQRTVSTVTVFDWNDRPYRNIDPNGKSSYTDYDLLNRPIRETDIFGNATQTLYDDRGLVIQITTPLGTVTRTVYDVDGRASYGTDEYLPGTTTNGTHTIYDDSGRVIRTERVTGLVISIVYVNGMPRSVLTNPGTVISITQTIYNDLGETVKTISASGHETDFQYDVRGLQTAVTEVYADQHTETMTTDYDPAGRAIKTSDALNHVTQTVYDDAGRPIKTIFADGTFTTVAYDNKGRKIAETDQMGRTTNFEYDDQGHLTAVVLPEVYDPERGTRRRPRTEYQYDNYGNLLVISDAKGHVTSFAFDQFDHQISRTLPDGSTETATFNDFGQLVTQVDFKGQKHTLQYDPLSRLQLEQWFAAGSNTPGLTVSYAYNSLGQTSQVNDYRGTTTYVYNLDGQTTQIATPEGTINYAYDPATGWHTRTWTANTEIDYGNDEVSRLQTVTLVKMNGQNLPTPQVTSYVYNAVGLVVSETRPDGSTVTNNYDVMNRLAELNDTVSGNTLLHDVYTRNADGRILTVSETQAQPSGGPVTTNIGYQYDELGRLISENQNSSLASSSFTATYNFDLVGNRLDYTKTAGSTVTHLHSTYNNRDELLTEATDVNGTPTSTTTHGYDLNGSEVSMVTAGSDTTSYNWDLANRIGGATITRVENGQTVVTTVSYQHNPGGITTRSDSTTTTNGVVTDQQSSLYLIDNNNPTGYVQRLEESDPQGHLQAMSEYGLAPIAQFRTGLESLYHMDGHSGARLLTNLAAVILVAYGFDAYGKLVRSVGSITNPVLYRGERSDPITGLLDLRGRPERAQSGRFIEADSFAGDPTVPATLHKYMYTGDDPINRIDPSGHFFGFVMTVINIAFDIGKRAISAAADFAAYVYIAAQTYLYAFFTAIISGWGWLSSRVQSLLARIPQIPGAIWDRIVSWLRFLNTNPQRLVPGGGLQAHEGVKRGHTILEHVGKSYSSLVGRLGAQDIKAASSFPDLETAEVSVSEALAAHQAQITTWLAGPNKELVFTQSFSRNIGVTLVGGQDTLTPASNMFIKLVRDASMSIGYYIRTAYPRLEP